MKLEAKVNRLCFGIKIGKKESSLFGYTKW
jgi:hypothetical protein